MTWPRRPFLIWCFLHFGTSSAMTNVVFALTDFHFRCRAQFLGFSDSETTDISRATAVATAFPDFPAPFSM